MDEPWMDMDKHRYFFENKFAYFERWDIIVAARLVDGLHTAVYESFFCDDDMLAGAVGQRVYPAQLKKDR